eukprot:1898564-Prymnesium_polylepis.1
MELLRQQSRVASRVDVWLRAPCRCAERGKIYAGPHVYRAGPSQLCTTEIYFVTLDDPDHLDVFPCSGRHQNHPKQSFLGQF